MLRKKLDFKTKTGLFLIVVLALCLRLYGINWDDGHYLHPDERYVTLVAASIRWPHSLSEYLNPQTSPLSPYNTEYKAYIYGTFPLFWVKAAATLIGWDDYSKLYLVGRFWSALFDTGTLFLVFWVGQKFWNRKIGLLAALLYALTVLSVQQSHFFTVDNFATFWILASFVSLIKFLEAWQDGVKFKNLPRAQDLPKTAWLRLGYLTRDKLRWAALLGVTFGLATASKISSLLFGGVIGLGFLLGFVRVVSYLKVCRQRELIFLVLSYGFLGMVFAFVAYATFRLIQPYAFARANWLDLSPQPDFWRALTFQREAMKGKVIFPPSYQWLYTVRYWFLLKNLILWGLGLPLGFAVLLGMACLGGRLLVEALDCLRQKRWFFLLDKESALFLILGWPLGLFLYHGDNFVKTMRYFLPGLPFVVLVAAYGLRWLWLKDFKIGRLRIARWQVIGVLVGTMFWALSYVNIYSRETTRVTASRWIYQHIPSGAVIANEHWDDPLPLILSKKELPNSNSQIPTYTTFQMEVYNPDLNPEGLRSEVKLRQLYTSLQRADYVVLSSPRASGSIGHLPREFPLMTRYYALLKDGQLGFKRVLRVTSFPGLLGVKIDDNLAEEAFWVYDHPPVEIYKKNFLVEYSRFKQMLLTGED